MKPFQFKLAALLTIRQKEEQAKLELYAKAMQTRQVALEARNAVERAVEVLRDEVRQSMRLGCSANVLSQFQGYGLRLSDDLRAANERLAATERSLAAALGQLQVARRGRETVEKFQERERAVYDREVLVEEQKLLDEMALRRIGSRVGFAAS
ncbi:MAG TPA: flagellar export protein FliJ [Candidatus Limnocylindria bacterium]|jgi:flagellar FliJ protein|nr:flagellar export protein FliJ [Candidatus Limnocylindria bacterium]